MKTTKTLAIFMVLSILYSCKQDDPEIPHEEELITTLTYTLTPEGGGNKVVSVYKDLDADGTTHQPEITNGTLAASTTYDGVITLSNEAEDPSEDITAEIKEEIDEHQFFFTKTPNGLTVSYSDENLGLATKLITDASYSGGTLTIVLKHEPNKTASGVTINDPTNAGGETDIEATFELK